MASYSSDEIEKAWALRVKDDPASMRLKLAWECRKERLVECDQLEERKIAELSREKLQLYKMLVFYTLYQVIFLWGMTRPSSKLECEFCAETILIYCLLSFPHFVGALHQFQNLYETTVELQQVAIHKKILESSIRGCEREFLFCDSFQPTEDHAENIAAHLQMQYNKFQLRRVQYVKIGVLVFLAVFSSLNAYLIFVAMCHKY